MKRFSIKTVIAIGIGAILFFVCGHFVSIPSPVPSSSFTIQYGVLAFMSCVFGPAAGALIGIAGHILIDLSAGKVWWSWVIASGLFGLFSGVLMKKINLEEGVYGKKDILCFNLSQLVSHAVCWVLVAPALDVLIYREPMDKLMSQCLVCAAGNAVTTAIVGTILCAAYAKARPQK